MRNVLSAMMLMAFPFFSNAEQKPPELTPAINSEIPMGTATLEKWMLHVYDAAFWSDSGNWQTPPYALTITYAMNFSAQELAGRTYDEMVRVTTLPEEKIAQFRERLIAIYPDVTKKDRITALVSKKNSTIFFCNGSEIGRITDPVFAGAFFAIWLSEKSSEPQMQQALIGNRTNPARAQ